MILILQNKLKVNNKSAVQGVLLPMIYHREPIRSSRRRISATRAKNRG
ncbi:Hypothetical protein BN2458_PEG0048 [Helicobacter typhlonius]|uniref:Uncharacterized protein n=1 Tax=Helicobacter typhlonius TaxID=76936 RepID=A0A0S4PTF4_9HELI|nr:Hypothetical protein BN2458_PEG0048 [Helicobacter typhlonius]